MATISDVAKRAGVSPSTVSRALSGNIPVNEETRNKVLEAVKELNYKPNIIAKGLKEGKTNTIGLIIPDIRNPIFPEVAKGVEDTAREKGYNIILCNTDESIDTEKEIVAMLKKRWVDGIVFATASGEYNHILELKQQGFPMVALIRNTEEEFETVVTNNVEAAYEATKYLIQEGNKKIAIINGNLELSLYKERFEGYKKALLEANYTIDENYIYNFSKENDECYLGIKDILSKEFIPDAIFATTDLKAIEAIRAIKDVGLKIPEDISIIGFDDIQISSYIDPKLTTVAQPFYEMGVLAVNKLVERIENKELIDAKPNINIINSKLIIRNSTKSNR